MSTSIKNITGTFDILPAGSTREGVHPQGTAEWQYVERQIRDVFERFQFSEIRTPILEPTELIARGIGQLTDIVSKEMFAFEREDTHYVLRPEVTAPVMRAYLQHHMDQLGGAQKVFYIGPCFRAERPQKGRYRQFHQFGAEVIGVDHPMADAETIAVMMAVYDAFGVTNQTLRINTLGDTESRPRYREALRAYFEPYASELTETSLARLEKNPMRILDTKNERERKLLADAPRLIDYVDAASLAHYDAVKAFLVDVGVTFVEDPFLVRGLDYYTRTAFELESGDLGAQSALAGGGRYDLLAREIGNDDGVPAVGFAAGIERLFLALEALQHPFPAAARPDAVLIALGEAAGRWAFRAALALRKAGLRVNVDLQGRSMKAQMRDANRAGAQNVVIVGDSELAQGAAQVKHMATGNQESVALDALATYLGSNATTAS
ncbi:MAG: histidine--tRNA ligase [Rhodothermales bacterium]